MSLISAFVDAVRKAFGRKREVDIEEVRSTGGAVVDDGTVRSSDPEEGGENRSL